MKKFWKLVLAVICGVLILNLITIAILSGLATPSKPAVPSEGVLRIDMSKVEIGEQTKDQDPMAMLQSMGKEVKIVGILDASRAVRAAAEDPGIKFIYLKTDGSSTGIALSDEFRKALAEYREISGNPVVAYVENPSTGSYYLATVADKIYMAPYPGTNYQFSGVSSQMFFLGDLLKRLGVNVQLIRHGKYKSAGEMYTRANSSPENREQYQRMVNSLWENLSASIAESRGLSVEQLNDLIDNLKLCVPQDFLDNKLVDALLDRKALEDQLAVLAGAEKYDDLKMIDFADYAAAKAMPSKATKKIAVIYADGEIVDGVDETNVDGDRFASIIEKVRKDKTVKAVVLRVNSPGGSVVASDKIKYELDRLKAEKPLVASYGSMAASGGYWISNNCEKIFTSPYTLTGSIGVFGMIPEFSKTASELLHVGVETVSSNKHGDMFSLTRPFDKDEYDYVLRSIEEIYDRFTTIVSEGRDIPKEQVDAIGQGRVWTGADAIGIKLTDEYGTLEDAIAYVADLAGDPDVAHWNVKGYPAPLTMMEQITNSLNNKKEDYTVRLIKEYSQPRVLARMENEIRFY